MDDEYTHTQEFAGPSYSEPTDETLKPRFFPEVVVESWERVAPRGDAIALRFYAILFRAHPELRKKFPFHMAKQRDKLFKTINTLVQALKEDKLGTKANALHKLGEKHAQEFGVEPQHYPMVGGALLSTLKYYDKDYWDPDLEYSWSMAYGTVAEIMLEDVA